ncbi:hypothetical protein [Actinacidiphila bryophytorum]|uniref:ABC transporter ATP-binding protein n=1 Tax=Actinacidiphila bryophytorum TaxID=1436133 RepID=A0A9W4GZ97_9ACTN|nr:hypothetical protein SBRY_11174 [Actinacidiphila bryophytorum]
MRWAVAFPTIAAGRAVPRAPSGPAPCGGWSASPRSGRPRSSPRHREPSSGPDAEAEAEIHQRLRELRSGRASLLISHRLGTVRDADRIVVLDGGRITESGDHASLLAAGGTYARLFRLQADGCRDGGPPAGPQGSAAPPAAAGQQPQL